MPNSIDLPRLEALHAEATRFYASGRIELTHDDETARRWAVVVFEAFPALLAEVKELRAERDRLRAEAVAEGAVRTKLRAELADRDVTIAGLREALEWIENETATAGTDLGMPHVAAYCKAKLARTPSQHRARIEAGVLRHAANLIRQTTPDGEMKTEYYSGMNEGRMNACSQIEEMAAERLERQE